MNAASRSVVAALALLLTATGRLPAQTGAEPPRKGFGGLLGKAADRLKGEAMKRFDRNGDGVLDEAERAEALETLKKKGGEVQAQLKQFMLQRFDVDGDGTLDEAERKTAFDETMKQLEEHGPMVKNTLLGFVYRRFDANGDGTLDKDELATAREELTRRILQGSDGAPSRPLEPAARKKQADQARKQEMLDRFDADGDGELDQQESDAAKADLKRRSEELDSQPPAPR